MDFNKYRNKRPYPNVRDHTTIYYYSLGKAIAVREPDGSYYLIMADGSRKWIEGEPEHAAAETVVDERTYRALRDEYGAEESWIYEEFKRDLFEELGIENHPKRQLLFEKAWERGHSSGYSEVYNVALDLVDLIL